MTPRETFERIRAHLLAQGRRAFVPGVGCVYRHDPGEGPALRCAVGCLVPDDLYDPLMEGAGVASLEVGSGRWEPPGWNMQENMRVLARVLNEAGVPATAEHRRVLLELQRLHDGTGPARWGEALEDLSTWLFPRGEGSPP